MFAAGGFGQLYFGQGPMTLIASVDGPIDVINVVGTHPGANGLTHHLDSTTVLTTKRPRAIGLRARKPTANLE
jgi:hypothetical protein